MSESDISKRFRWKGKFVTQKKCNALKTRVQNGKNSKKNQRKLEERSKPTFKSAVKGNRIINVELLQQSMYCSKCEKPLLLQNIENETIRGFASIFKVRCQSCFFLSSIKTQDQYNSPVTGKPLFSVNTKSVLG